MIIDTPDPVTRILNMANEQEAIMRRYAEMMEYEQCILKLFGMD